MLILSNKVMTMKNNLKDLLTNLPAYKLTGETNLNITSVTDDSRNVKNGSLFIAIQGIKNDGHDYIKQAVSSGAAAVVGQRSLKNVGVTYIKVEDSRVALSHIASNWYGNPSTKLKLIGVTGTDGKTTTANIIYSILKDAKRKVGLISTVSAKIGDKDYDTGFHVTNPQALALQKFLALMVKKKCEYAVLEVTSHGLDQKRVSGMSFDVSVLTNITHEHLDYHKTYEDYLRTKAKLFQMSKLSILNKDDTSFAKVNKLVNGRKETYSLNNLDSDIKAAIYVRFQENFNRSNAAAAATVAKILKIPSKVIVHSIKLFKGVKGRQEEIKNNKSIKIIIDYAHTPNAVENILKSIKLGNGSRLISIVSAEGERDPNKRLHIPKVAVKYSHITILNPIDTRSEDPKKIADEMIKGAKSAGGKKLSTSFPKNNAKTGLYRAILDRGEAINFVINKLSKKSDVVVICGKGHETGMDFGSKELPWSDQKAVNLALKGKILRLKKI